MVRAFTRTRRPRTDGGESRKRYSGEGIEPPRQQDEKKKHSITSLPSGIRRNQGRRQESGVAFYSRGKATRVDGKKEARKNCVMMNGLKAEILDDDKPTIFGHCVDSSSNLQIT